MVKPNSTFDDGEHYRGYCIDLLKEISKIYGFKYEINLVKDNGYGNRNSQGEWNGMIRQLIDREADMALGDLTITYERENVVDFTIPFMIFGISILLRHPNKETPHLFTFLSPLSLEVWVAIATSYLVITVVLYSVARFTPLEWVMRRKNDHQRLVLENQFNLSASIWFTVGSFTQQGSNITPRAVSTRILAITWWFFTLITLCTYTANLAAFMTVQRMSLPILTVEDLQEQSQIRYGCVENSTTANFFKMSDIPVYKKIWMKMHSMQSSVFTKSEEEGIERVLKENYAFFMESVSIEYITQRHCNLIQTGGLLDSRGYGIATPPGSPYLPLFSDAILKLQEKGILEDLKQKWWKNEDSICPERRHSITSLELNIARIGGIFILLTVGLCVSFMVVAIEYFCQRRTPEIPSTPLRFVESEL